MKYTSSVAALGSALLILALAVSLALAQEEVVLIPTGQDMYFKEDATTSSNYLHLGSDGRYVHIDREHMFVEENDRGVWHQDASGIITLESELHYRNIEAAPLSIWTWHRNVAEYLPRIQEEIARHIADPAVETFDAKYVAEEMVLVPSRYGKGQYCPLAVEFPTEHVTKEQLSLLLDQIGRFKKSPDKNHLHVIPYRYKKYTVLQWKDHHSSFNRDMQQLKELIDKSPDTCPPRLIYLAIDRVTFDQEAHLTQEFIFYPEMTEKVRKAIEQKEKTAPEGSGSQ